MEKFLVEIIVLMLPAAVFAVHKRFPGNKITPYFIPRLLADRPYPKSELRQAGSAHCLLGIWIFLWIAASTYSFLRSIERQPILLALFYFILPILSVMAIVIGMSYGFSGLFGRGDRVKPKLESIDAAQKDDLPRYIRKLEIYNVVNLSCPFLVFFLILAEEALGIAEKGFAILLNVALLITFIMTLWRIRAYLVKAAKVMDLASNEILMSTLFSPFGIFFVWIHSFLLIRRFKRQQRLG